MWEFLLVFRLPSEAPDATMWLDALYEAGCDDATIGVGTRGAIALSFSRRAMTAEQAIHSATADVLKAIPGAVLTSVGESLFRPDP